MDAGPNTVLEQLNGIGAVKRLAGAGGKVDAVETQVAQWRGDRPAYGYRRWQEAATGDVAGVEVGLDIARLWARDEVAWRAAQWDSAAQSEAQKIALAYQIVTPVSGAVVLETQQQYEQADLTPAAPETVPRVIPEPACVQILVLGGLLLARRLRWSHK
jgi:hypothetical protein